MEERRIPSSAEEWKDAVDDAVTYVKEKSRQFGPNETLLVIDDIVLGGTVSKSDLMTKHRITDDKMKSHLALITMAVHRRGVVPKVGGWYCQSSDPTAYSINPAFAVAWKAKRRLPLES